MEDKAIGLSNLVEFAHDDKDFNLFRAKSIAGRIDDVIQNISDTPGEASVEIKNGVMYVDLHFEFDVR